MHLKIITQIQITPISITTENNPIKKFHIVLLLSILSLLFIIVSLIVLVHSSITLPTYLTIFFIQIIYTLYTSNVVFNLLIIILFINNF